jgi:YVTN family beta-propeller protein
MVHGISLREGRAEWYRNRYVGSTAVSAVLGRPDVPGRNWNGSTFGPNTNVGGFAGTTWAMVEAGGCPVELSHDLETLGRNDFYGTLPGAFSAHPKVDPVTGGTTATYGAGDAPFGVIVAFGSVWVANSAAGTVSRLSTTNGSPVATITVGTGPMFFAAGFDSIWVTNINSSSNTSTVSRSDPTDNSVTPISGVSRPVGITAGATHIWVANNTVGNNTVSKIDPATNAVVATANVVERPYAVAAGFDHIWVTSQITGSLSKIDPATNAVVATLTGVGGGSYGVAAGSGSMWVTHYGSGTVSRINPTNNTVTETFPVGTTPWGIAADNTAVWVANYGSSNIAQIAT